MTLHTIRTEDAPVPGPTAPLAQGVRKGPILQVSGRLPLDPRTGAAVGRTVAEQTAQALRNVTAVLTAGGAGLQDVVMLRVCLTAGCTPTWSMTRSAVSTTEGYPAASANVSPSGIRAQAKSTANSA